MNKDILYQYRDCVYCIQYVVSKRGQRWYKIRTENGEAVGRHGQVYTEEDAVDLCQEHYIDTHARPHRRRAPGTVCDTEQSTEGYSRNQEIRKPSLPKGRQSDNQDYEIGKDLIQIDNYLEFTEPVLDLSDFAL